LIGVAVKGADRAAKKVAEAAASVKKSAETAMREAVKLVTRNLKERMTGKDRRHPFWGKVGADGHSLSARSGKTRASLTAGTRIYWQGKSVIGVVGSAEKSLKLHEDGGTIGPTKGQYLRIPTKMAQTPAGVDRWAGRSARDIPGTFLVRAGAGKKSKLWVVRAIGGSYSGIGPANVKRMDFLYLLVRSVNIRPRKLFQKTMEVTQTPVREITRAHVTQIVNKANS
jgi:hypothetical protein